jgi:ABC-type multidrug transport system permease subunit
MKKNIVDTFFTTGISIIGLTLYFVVTKENTVFVHTILELFVANILINFGFYIRDRFEIVNLVIEHIIGITYVLVILVLFGIIFKWFSIIPVWILIVSGISIYIMSYILMISRIKKDTNEINEILQKLQE